MAPGLHALNWSYADESLWRGLSDNNKIIRLARSMITSGYRQDEPINCRISDLTALAGVLVGKLLFGDGQARGLAARLAFHFLLNTVRTSQDSLMGGSRGHAEHARPNPNCLFRR